MIFPPQIPGLEILNNGIEIMLDLYKQTCQPYGLIDTRDYTIRHQSLIRYFERLSELEIGAMKEKYLNRHKYHEDKLVETYFSISEIYQSVDKIDRDAADVVECDFDGYKKAYYLKKLNIITDSTSKTTMRRIYQGIAMGHSLLFCGETAPAGLGFSHTTFPHSWMI